MFGLYWRIVIRPNRGRILLLGAVSLAAAMAEVASIGLVIPVVALFSGAASPTGQKFLPVLESVARSLGLAAGSSALLVLALAGVTGLVLLKFALSLKLNKLTAFVSQDTKMRLMLQMFTAYTRARYAELVRRNRGAIAKDIEIPPDSMGYVVYYSGLSLAAASQLILTLGFLAWLSPGLTLVMGAVGLATVYLFRSFLQERMANLGRKDYPLEQAVAGMVVEAIDGVRIVKVHNLVDRLRGRLEKDLASRLEIVVSRLLLQQVPKISFELFGMLVVVILIGLAQMVPGMGLDFPALAAFVLALRQITPAASTLNTNFLNMAQYWRQIQVIDEALKLPGEDNNQGNVRLPDVIRSVSLDAVTFAYPENPAHKVLNDLSLTFARGRVTALVGGTGAGKTTIADILLRLQEPSKGRVLANDTDIHEFALAEWRQQIGYVGQEVFLFNATLAQNIAALDDRIPLAEIEKAARVTQIHDFIMTLPAGYQTNVGDRGVKLSGGQRQRIAVARAILKRPKVLILDEATSALDNLTERALHEAIDYIRHEAVVIIIAHRLSTVEDADEIVVLEGGRVVERGSHDVLLARQGLYRQLYTATRNASPAGNDPVHAPEDRG